MSLLGIGKKAEDLLSKLWIEGQVPLAGSVPIGGSKNSALGLVAASLLAQEGHVVLENVAPGSDVQDLCDIIAALGADVRWPNPTTVEIWAGSLRNTVAPYDLARKLRVSPYVLGALVTRMGEGSVAFPGGCQIGSRPVDFHTRGLQALGAEVSLEHGSIRAQVAGRLKGTRIYIERASVGTTVNMMIAAALAEGTTTLENAAMEPEIVDLANFLTAMGAHIRGAGTNLLRIEGVERLTGVRHEVIPDRIEAGTYLMAGAASRGRVTVSHIIPEHIGTVLAKLQQVGATIEMGPDSVTLELTRRPRAVDIETMPYPGFPTDLHPPMAALLTTADGISVVQETIFDNRFAYTHELARMGANVKVERDTAIIRGTDHMTGAPVEAQDLRGGIALVVAGLGAAQETEVSGMHHVERGYVGLVDKLEGLGAHVRVLA
jgi:UDP-N-acetylglucosamine 1-carboxyvinyltransferase